MTTTRIMVSQTVSAAVRKELVMIRAGRMLLLAALVSAAATTARAQSPARAPDAPSPSEFTVPPPPVATPQAAVPGGPPTPTFAPAPLPGPYFEVDPLLDRPPLPQPGWLADADLGAVIPHVKNHLSGEVPLPLRATPDMVALPSAPLDWTVYSRVEAGYRLPSGFGAIALSFRGVDTDGNATTAGLDGPAALHSRFSLYEGGLDYLSDQTSLWPHWDMKWSVGLRLLYAFFDSQAIESSALAAAGSAVVEQRESNWYCGVGPHLGLELDREIGCSGWAFVLRGEGSIYIGRLRQAFFETSTTGVSAESSIPVSQGVPEVSVFAGFRWRPPQWNAVEFSLGYQYEYWWDVGRNNDTTSSGDVEVQGVFVRAAFNY
jgi:hypothetical protein